ncbi:PP2C family protein-serine/threonine phosphatase [Microbacterium halotolerans]|uniref:PP2C family protein-serine/threonine phosphatase n=1 Tax=Microbacterium halotolerans TaxID=246613 RepID=UPI001F08F1DE|nr:protein phosphatase 2C domain-containing protein [Microbacterium halotolerans]
MSDTTSSVHSHAVALDEGGELVVRWAGVTDTGRKREVNQDAILMEWPMFVVADGMGGHIGGEVASAVTVERLSAVASSGEAITPETVELALENAVRDIADHPETTDEGTGTTVTGIYLDPASAPASWVVLNIGDSRVYLLRDDKLVQVTVDHSLVQELVHAGRLSAEEAESHPYGNVITRAVGPSESVVPDYVRIEVEDGDRFVICSDGLTKELTDYGILHFLREHAAPDVAVGGMVEAALGNGGRDNVSVIVVDVTRSGGPYGDADQTGREAPDAGAQTTDEAPDGASAAADSAHDDEAQERD